MNSGDFLDILQRGNINPKYNELLGLIVDVNEKISNIEDELDILISKPTSPSVELKLKRLIEIMERVRDVFNDVESE